MHTVKTSTYCNIHRQYTCFMWTAQYSVVTQKVGSLMQKAARGIAKVRPSQLPYSSFHVVWDFRMCKSPWSFALSTLNWSFFARVIKCAYCLFHNPLVRETCKECGLCYPNCVCLIVPLLYSMTLSPCLDQQDIIYNSYWTNYICYWDSCTFGI